MDIKSLLASVPKPKSTRPTDATLIGHAVQEYTSNGWIWLTQYGEDMKFGEARDTRDELRANNPTKKYRVVGIVEAQ